MNIPENSIKIQEGLYLYEKEATIGGKKYTFRELFAENGFCFYENYLKEEDRIYMEYSSVAQVLNTVELINKWYTCIAKESVNVESIETV